MLKISLLVIPVLLLFSCLKEDLPLIEEITRGSKWGLEIGNSSEDVYSRLQELGIEKEFSRVALVGRKQYSKPADIEESLRYYDFVTLQNRMGRVERVVIQFPEDTVNSIGFGGALPEEVGRWPLEVADSSAIAVGDLAVELYNKLRSIYQIPQYSDYSIGFPDKPLSKSFDPAMKDFNEWAFTFFVDVEPGKEGRSSVRLYFKEGRLDEIYHRYEEFEVQ